MTTQEQTAADRPTVEEMTESLTGFEEVAIEEHFGADVSSIKSPTKMLRALIFVARIRAGDRAKEAKQAAQELTLKQVTDYFVDDDEVTPDAPATAAGKDDERPG